MKIIKKVQCDVNYINDINVNNGKKSDSKINDNFINNSKIDVDVVNFDSDLNISQQEVLNSIHSNFEYNKSLNNQFNKELYDRINQKLCDLSLDEEG